MSVWVTDSVREKTELQTYKEWSISDLWGEEEYGFCANFSFWSIFAKSFYILVFPCILYFFGVLSFLTTPPPPHSQRDQMVLF